MNRGTRVGLLLRTRTGRTGVALAALLLLQSVLASPAAAEESAVEWSGSQIDYAGDGPFTLGFRFRAESDLAVTALGAYDAGRNGLQHTHPIGIWRLEGGDPLVTSVVPATTAKVRQTLSAVSSHVRASA